MHGIRVMTCALVFLALAGCGLAEDLAEMQAKAETLADALEKEFGARPQVGWNVHNDVLTNVNVSFPLEAVSAMPVGELQSRVRGVVVARFETPPQALVVSVVSQR